MAPTNGASVSFTGGSNLNTTNDLTGLVLSNNVTAGGYSLDINSASAVSIAGNQLTIGSGKAGEIRLYGGNHTISADLKLTDISSLVVFNGGTKTISGVISGTRGAGGPDEVAFQADSDSHRIILSNVNTYETYSTIINRGIVQVTSLRNGNQASSLGKGSLIRAGVIGWNATIDYVGTGDSTDRKIRIGDYGDASYTGSVSLLNNGSGALVWTAATLNDYQNFGGNTLANRVVTLGGTNADNNEIQSIITNNKGADNGTSFSDTVGTIGITKTGTGRWILSGSNSYTGANTIAGGLLIAANANALGSAYAGTTVSSGAALGLQGNVTTAAEALSLTGTGPGSAGALRNISGNNTYAGAVTLAGNTTIGADAGSLTVSGAVTGTSQVLTVVGGGAVTLANAGNTFGSGLTGNTAGLVVDGGTLRNGVNNAVNSNLIAQVKSGTWDLNGYNQTVRSEWGKGLLLGDAAGSSAPTVTTGAGTLTIQGETVSGAQARIDYSSTGNPLGGVVNDNVAYSSPANILAVVVGDSTNAAIDLTINAVISKVGGGSGGFFLKGDTGTLLLNGLNTFNVASPRVDDGTLILGVNDPANGSAGALGQGTAQVTVGRNGTGNRDAALLLRDGVTSARWVRTMNNTNTGRAGDIRTLGGYDSTGTSTFSGRIELFNAANDGGTTRLQALGTSTVNFSGQIVDDTTTTAVGINKIGTGTVVLSGNNAYRGGTTISAGTLVVVRTNLTARIESGSTTVDFSATPGVGTNNVLPGPLNTASLDSVSFNGLGPNLEATLTNSPNLQVVVTSKASAGPTYSDVFGSSDPLADDNGDGVANLMAYALGATAANSSVARPELSLTSGNLTLTALVRTNDPKVQILGNASTALTNWPTNTFAGTPAADQTGAVSGVTQKQVFSVERDTNSRQFLRLKATLQP